MANCLNYDCTTSIGTHSENRCGEELLGGASGLLLLECNHQLTSASSVSQINAEIAAGRAHLLRSVKIGVEAPSAVEIDSNVSGGSTKLVTYNRTLTLIDGNVSSANVSFYDGVFGGRQFGGAILYLVGTEESTSTLVYYIDAAISFTGGLVIPNDQNSYMTFTGTAKWKKKTMPTLATAPVGIFE
jgi:hypothetical protein